MLIEKPLTLFLYEADRLIDRSEQSHCKVMVGFNKHWHRPCCEMVWILSSSRAYQAKSERAYETETSGSYDRVHRWKISRYDLLELIKSRPTRSEGRNQI